MAKLGPIRTIKKKKTKFYGVKHGYKTGVFESWSECEYQVTGFKGAVFKSFDSQNEAIAYVTGLHQQVFKPEPMIQRGKDEDKVIVYTDGACTNNGNAQAVMGCGVFFGDGDPRNVACPGTIVADEKSTNNRAELEAIMRALERIPEKQDAEIRTDSSYSRKMCVNLYNYRKNGWKTLAGTTVKNLDLLISIETILQKRYKAGSRTHFVWVKAHSSGSEHGNLEADRFARKGATEAKIKSI